MTTRETPGTLTAADWEKAALARWYAQADLRLLRLTAEVLAALGSPIPFPKKGRARPGTRWLWSSAGQAWLAQCPIPLPRYDD